MFCKTKELGRGSTQIKAEVKSKKKERSKTTHTRQHVSETLEAGNRGVRERVVDEGGKIHRNINIYVNEIAVENLKGKDTALVEGDEVSLIPAIAGGAIPFTEEQIKRYSRHIILPEVGGRGQASVAGAAASAEGG